MPHFVNLTPHPVTVYRMDTHEPLVILHPQEPAFRLEEKEQRVSKEWLLSGHAESGMRDGNSEVVNWGPVEAELYQMAVPIVRREYVAAGLPEPAPGLYYVVSLPALMGLKAAGIDRRDVVAPDTGPGPWGAVRDAKGNVCGCYRFVTLGEFPEGIYCKEGWTPEEWLAANPRD